MRLLLDTHVALWAVTSNPKLGRGVLAQIADPANDITVSAVTVWEIAIKHPLARGNIPVSPSRALQLFEAAGYALLPVTPQHAAAVADLPRQHGDPFDRLLVAQALTEPLRLVTRDRKVAAYSDTIILV